MTINHELCSELLAPFLRGELDDARRREVEAHVASCTGCREELRALEALEGAEVEPLSELESARLRRDVWATVGASEARPARKPLGARLLPYLGTAAVLALFAVGAVNLSGDGADDSTADAARELSLDSVEDQDSAGRDADGGAAEEGRITGESPSPLAYEDSLNASSELENGTEPGAAAGAQDEALSAESEAATFDATAKQLFLLGCAIGAGTP